MLQYISRAGHRTAIAAAGVTGLTAALLVPVSIAAQPASAATTAAATSSVQSVDQAIAQALKTGHPVPVPASTTATTTVTANPDETISVSTYAAPVRKNVSGTWKALDPTLLRNADGSVSPAVSTIPLTIGKAGSTRLATQGTGSSAFGIDLPFTLPAPTLSGSTATYPNVLPAIDLQVTADPQGGFSEVFVVKNASAAANPTLRSLTLSVPNGLVASSDDGGNISVKDATGRVVATAPTPLMWDSSQPSATLASTADPNTGQAIDNATGLAVSSSALSAGEAAHTAPIGIAAAGTNLKLAPDAGLLSSSSTVWPVYVDPSFTNPHVGGDNNSWATVRSDYPTTSYVKTSDPLRVGYQGWDSPFFKARSFIQFPLSSNFYDGTIISAAVVVQETYAPSCTARQVDLYHTGYITSGITWNSQPSKGASAGHVTDAHGYNTSCPVANISFNDQLTDSSHDLTDIMQTGASDHWTKVAFGLYAHDEGDKYGWKKFDNNSANLTVVYNHTPNAPTISGLATSPKTTLSTSTTCASTPTGMTTIGKGDVTLSVKGSDPDGGTIGVGVAIFKTSTATQLAGTSSSATSSMVTSGTTFNWKVDESILDTAAVNSSGTPVATDFYWRSHIYDGYTAGGWSPYCHFIYDPTVPGAPSVTVPASGLKMGTASTFTINPPASGTVPAKYQYSLNGGTVSTVTATSGVASISVTPTRTSGNVLIVNSVSAGGNVSTQSALATFDAAAATSYADGDLTGDGVADQLNAGAATGTPAPGLWLARGTGSVGAFIAATTNVGIGGNGVSSPGAASDFNGGKPIVGAFTGGITHNGTQDQLVYYPSTGSAVIIPGNGDGTLNSSGAESFQVQDDAGNATQVVAAGNVSGNGYDFPDLLATAPSGTGIQALYLVPNLNIAGQYLSPVQLTSVTPTGGTDWTGWQIASAKSSTTGTNLYLWNTSSKVLYLWRNLSYTDNGDGTGTLTGQQYRISASWNPAPVNSLESADFNNDGIPDLRVISTTGTATAYLVSALPTPTALGAASTTAATVTAQTTQTLTW